MTCQLKTKIVDSDPYLFNLPLKEKKIYTKPFIHITYKKERGSYVRAIQKRYFLQQINDRKPLTRVFRYAANKDTLTFHRNIRKLRQAFESFSFHNYFN